MSEFIIRAALAGIGVAVVSGVLGCFIVWRRMVYFGDALSHASILGVALAMAFGVSIYIGVAGIAGAIAILLVVLTSKWQSMDTILGVVAHSFLAVGLIAASVFGTGVSIEAILFGDILAVTWSDVVLIWCGVVAILGIVAARWRNFIVATVCDDLAASVGVRVKLEQFILTLCLAIVVGVALKTVGALLITAFLIIPAAAARSFSKTPERMAAVASAIGGVGALGGLVASYELDWPAGPAMVAICALIFVVSRLRLRADV
jgi:zinc transport system permease protein